MDSFLEPEYKDLFDTWKKTPDPANTDVLLKAVDPVISSALKTYVGSKVSPTLRSKAKLITIDALNRYDPMKAKLRSHLMVNLQSLHRAATRESQIISTPERVSLDLYHLSTAENELRDKLGRDPTDMELAKHTGLSRKRIGYIRMSKPGYSESSIEQMYADEESPISYSPAVVGRGDSDTWIDFVYHDLQPSDQLILEHSLGLHGKPVLSKQQIAKKLGVSPGAISQRTARIQSMLNRKEELGVTYF